MITPTQLIDFKAWKLDIFQKNPAGQIYIGHAKLAYRTGLNTGAPVTQDDIAIAIRPIVLSDTLFQKALIKRDPYLDVKDHSQNGTYFEVADLFAKCFVYSEWANIIR